MRHVIVHAKLGVFMGLSGDGGANWTLVDGPRAQAVVCWAREADAKSFAARLPFLGATRALPGYGDSVSRADLCAAGLGDLVGLLGLDLARMPPEGRA